MKWNIVVIVIFWMYKQILNKVIFVNTYYTTTHNYSIDVLCMCISISLSKPIVKYKTYNTLGEKAHFCLNNSPFILFLYIIILLNIFYFVINYCSYIWIFFNFGRLNIVLSINIRTEIHWTTGSFTIIIIIAAACIHFIGHVRS